MEVTMKQARGTRFPVGAIFRISGDSKDMWIEDYNVRVSTFAEVLIEPNCIDKKVLVRLNDIDHDHNVNVCINKKYLSERVN